MDIITYLYCYIEGCAQITKLYTLQLYQLSISFYTTKVLQEFLINAIKSTNLESVLMAWLQCVLFPIIFTEIVILFLFLKKSWERLQFNKASNDNEESLNTHVRQMSTFNFYKCKKGCKSYTIMCMKSYERYKNAFLYAEQFVCIGISDIIFRTLQATLMN